MVHLQTKDSAPWLHDDNSVSSVPTSLTPVETGLFPDISGGMKQDKMQQRYLGLSVKPSMPPKRHSSCFASRCASEPKRAATSDMNLLSATSMKCCHFAGLIPGRHEGIARQYAPLRRTETVRQLTCKAAAGLPTMLPLEKSLLFMEFLCQRAAGELLDADP